MSFLHDINGTQCIAPHVKGRDGNKRLFDADEIRKRIENAAIAIGAEDIDVGELTRMTVINCQDKYDLTTQEIDDILSDFASGKATRNDWYGKLAAYIYCTSIYRDRPSTFSAFVRRVSSVTIGPNRTVSMVQPELLEIVEEFGAEIDAQIDREQDRRFTYHALKQMERFNLLRNGPEIFEQPQYMYMRSALQLYKRDLKQAFKVYRDLATHDYTLPSPALSNGFCTNPTLASCFVVEIKEDSLVGIYDTNKDVAMISKGAGGVGLNVHKIRAKGTAIAGTGGVSNGLIPMLKVFNNTARYVDQGGNKRPGRFAIYLEPWHYDFCDLLAATDPAAKEEVRVTDVFLAVWVPDLFLKRAMMNQTWSFFCPTEAPNLYTTYGDEFEALYEKYEKSGLARNTMPARKLWSLIHERVIGTGKPYIMFKDHVNRKTNHQNVGTIVGSNLCTEVVQFMDADHMAVCSLSSVSLPSFVEGNAYNLVRLADASSQMIHNVNKMIDFNKYPTIEAQRGAFRQRAIGLGYQGLADVFAMLKIPWTSKQARQLNRDIAEAVYYGALRATVNLAEKYGCSYADYEGSPMSKGILQFDMWGVEPSTKFNWPKLKERMAQFGAYNSLVVAPMPTASTANLMDNTECTEPREANVILRRGLSGEWYSFNKHLMKDLREAGLWNEQMRKKILANTFGSVQNIEEIPKKIRQRYLVAYEIDPKLLLEFAADRGPFVDQSQSTNWFIPNPTDEELFDLTVHAWKLGLKTARYYLRQKPATEAFKVGVSSEVIAKNAAKRARRATSDPDKKVAGSLTPPIDDSSLPPNTKHALDDEELLGPSKKTRLFSADDSSVPPVQMIIDEFTNTELPHLDGKPPKTDVKMAFDRSQECDTMCGS